MDLFQSALILRLYHNDGMGNHFMKRKDLVLRQKTKIAQKMPVDLREKLRDFRRLHPRRVERMDGGWAQELHGSGRMQAPLVNLLCQLIINARSKVKTETVMLLSKVLQLYRVGRHRRRWATRQRRR
ncbi:hypothetical protein M514_06460, partial [Trichuris suis]